MIETSEDADPVPFHVVCVFEKTGSTYMMLEQAAMADTSSDPDFSIVASEQISRLIVVQEYGAERLFVSHSQGLGSTIPLQFVVTALYITQCCL